MSKPIKTPGTPAFDEWAENADDGEGHAAMLAEQRFRTRCHPDKARAWLQETGWIVGPKRASRNGVTIPSPQDGRPYDLHDLACELGLWSRQLWVLIEALS